MARNPKAQRTAERLANDPVHQAILRNQAVALNALRTNVCPECGSPVEPNNSIGGWVQCTQAGALQFRKVKEAPACNWQGFWEVTASAVEGEMEIVTRYKAVDGREFSDERSCLHWELWLEDLTAANALLDAGESVWAALCRANARCGYDWAAVCRDLYEPVLSVVTKDTKLVIRHWQCKDAPGYQVRHIQADGDLFVFGDAGSWSGPYGNAMSARDLIRYAQDSGIGKAVG